VAFAAWGLVMPQSPLAAELSGDNRVIWTAIITVVGVAVLGLLSRSLQKPRTDTASAKTILSQIGSLASRIFGQDQGPDSKRPRPGTERPKPHGAGDQREDRPR
jgi:hypothetical protein